jgi:hypothetical protein
MAPNNHVGVLQTRREHTNPYLAPPGYRQRSIDNFKPIGTAEAPDLNNAVARLVHDGMNAQAGRPVVEEDQFVNIADAMLEGRLRLDTSTQGEYTKSKPRPKKS